MTAIHIENLSVAYDGGAVIDGMSLTIPSGSLFTLLGPSGCGKTTLLRTLAGFATAKTGTIRFGANDVTQSPPHRRNIGMVFQDYALFPDKTVFDNVAYGLRARKLDEAAIRPKVASALARVGLTGLDARLPAALSGGQRQRVALARALVIEPQLLLMDEPLSNLDAKLRVQVRQTIAQLQRDSGITTVFVTHDQEEALAISDIIGVMKAGRLEQVGTPSEIYETPKTAYVADFVGGANVLPITLTAPLAASSAVEVSQFGKSISARTQGALSVGEAFLVVRPESVRLSRERGAQTSALLGRVVHRQYLGTKTSYRVELNEGFSLSADVTRDASVGTDALSCLHIGDQVTVDFDPAATWLLPP